jgi:hypothetical protein
VSGKLRPAVEAMLARDDELRVMIYQFSSLTRMFE